MRFPAGNIRQLACVLWECAANANDETQKADLMAGFFRIPLQSLGLSWWAVQGSNL